MLAKAVTGSDRFAGDEEVASALFWETRPVMMGL